MVHPGSAQTGVLAHPRALAGVSALFERSPARGRMDHACQAQARPPAYRLAPCRRTLDANEPAPGHHYSELDVFLAGDGRLPGRPPLITLASPRPYTPAPP